MDSVLIFLASVAALADAYGFTAILSLAALDFLLGVAAAIRRDDFRWYYVGDIARKIGPMLIAFFAVKLFVKDDALTASVLAILSADLLGASLKNLAELFPTLKVEMPATVSPPTPALAARRRRS